MTIYFKAFFYSLFLGAVPLAVAAVFIVDQSSDAGLWSFWMGACAPGVIVCLRIFGDSFEAKFDWMVWLWQERSLLAMGASYVLLITMYLLRTHRFLQSLIGACMLVLLLSAFHVLAEFDWEVVKASLLVLGRLVFSALAFAFLVMGVLKLFGLVVYAANDRYLKEVFVIHASHVTHFPQAPNDTKNNSAQFVSDIDGLSGTIRISDVFSRRELEKMNLKMNGLVKITSCSSPPEISGSRPLYRRLKKFSGISMQDNEDSGKKGYIQYVSLPAKPQDQNGRLICVMHIEDRGKLFRRNRFNLDEEQKAKLGISQNDGREFAKLRIENASVWDWFYYVFDHTDPNVAWSFRMGLASSVVLMIIQLTFLEPLINSAKYYPF